MSLNRENVVWQSHNGLWNRAFYHVTWVGSEADGYDPEWDVEYSMDRFDWLSTGHTTEQGAHLSWKGANPGGCTVFLQGHPMCDLLDAIAIKHQESEWSG